MPYYAVLANWSKPLPTLVVQNGPYTVYNVIITFGLPKTRDGSCLHGILHCRQLISLLPKQDLIHQFILFSVNILFSLNIS